MAGTLGKVDLLPPADLNQDVMKFQISADAVATVQRMTGQLPTGPQGYFGEMPQDITVLDDNQLGQMLNLASQWCSYLDIQVAQADSEREAAQASLTYIRARIRMALKAASDGKKMTVQDKNDVVDTDPRVVDATSRTLYTESVYQLTRAIRERAQRNWETVSRRITQRGQEVDRARRDHSVAGVPAAASRVFRHNT